MLSDIPYITVPCNCFTQFSLIGNLNLPYISCVLLIFIGILLLHSLNFYIFIKSMFLILFYSIKLLFLLE